MNLKLGPTLQFPATDAVTQTLVVYGGKGMGKTNFGVVLAEELARTGRRFAALDPVGTWYGLRHAANGKSPGVEVLVLGGKHGDLPIDPSGGAVVADLVADEDVNVVVDISRRPNGSMWSLGERYRFVADYTLRLYERQGERRRPIMQIIDEAGRFCPQLIPHGSPEIMRCVGAVERLVEEGRNAAIGVCLLTQRSARMNKSISELAECMVAFRTVGPRSVDAILDWFGEHVPKSRWKELVEQLRELPRGEALVVSPGWLKFEGVAKIRARWTFDTSATPTGGERRAVGRGAKPDLKKYEKRMAETVEKARLEDPRELQRELKVARAELAEAKVACGDYLKPHDNLKGAIKNLRQVAMTAKELLQLKGQRGKRVEVPMLKASQVKRFEATVCRWEKINEKTLKALGAMVTVAGEARDSLRKASAFKASTPSVPGPSLVGVGAVSSRMELVREQQRRGTGKVTAVMVSRRSVEGTLTGPERKILTALAQHGPRSTNALALLAGYAASGGAFRNPLSALRSKGYVANYGSAVTATPNGLEALGTWDPLPVGAALLEWWLGHLSGPEAKLLRAAAAKSPITTEALAEATGYEASGGAFRNPLSRLRTLGLVSGRGEIRVADELVQ
jgi:hypothetical protein